jgi:hypothetical protein
MKIYNFEHLTNLENGYITKVVEHNKLLYNLNIISYDEMIISIGSELHDYKLNSRLVANNILEDLKQIKNISKNTRQDKKDMI